MTVGAILMMMFGFGVTVGGASLCIRKAMSNK
ncbi:MetS family NSS transporter small subunit [Endozoicomonas gorgoniicola]|uniref:MetS family NSS transporter small subunit n=1 Tax=Endozoicomonas gorgoniicola TaxID=1234144 RepID=A0ABT3N3I6_9GAMM|nr:MetS family NSS transporter small subunit [Endozoicomonas gorgoniicola]MCW7556176.1 MetS family NSS transporter small subunit [Endozoicomonas gorgoniicola]